MDVPVIAEYKQQRSIITYEDKSEVDTSDTGNALPFRTASPSLEMMRKWLDERTALKVTMIEGYNTMAVENLTLAEENMSMAFETWPEWE